MRNGLLLRSDIHKLYDLGYVTVTPDLTFKVSERLRTNYQNEETYYALRGQRVNVPSNPAHHPLRERLDWHASTQFLR